MRPVLAALVLAAFVAVLPASAQPGRPARADTSEAARFRAADAQLRAGQAAEAVATLQQLYLARPGVDAYRLKLIEAYRAAERYGSALRVVERHLAVRPDDLSSEVERASLLHLSGDTAAASAAWDLVAGDARDETRVRAVAASLSERGLNARALALIERARERSRVDGAFGREIARLRGLEGDFAGAADGYLDLAARDAKDLGFAKTELGRLAEDERALPALVQAAAARARRDPTNRPLRELYAYLALEAGDFRRALDETRAVDRLDREEGRVLMLFARTAADAGAFEAAAEAYAEVVERYPSGPAAPEARFGLGALHERWADAAAERTAEAGTHGATAIAAFRAFLAAHPGHPAIPDALGRTGRLLLDRAGDAAAARAALDSVVALYPRSPAAEEAAFALGRVHLREGDLDGADLAFTRVGETLRTGDLADRARYESALIDLYRGDFDAALAQSDVLADNASADVANDAIGLKLLLIENRLDSLDAPLERYARAALLVRRGQPEAARDSLDAFLAALAAPSDGEAQPAEPHPILDDARALRADALREAGQPAEAAAALDALAREHPESYLADRALLDLAGLQEHALARPADAVATLDRLLAAYPGTLLAPEAERRLKRLRGAVTP